MTSMSLPYRKKSRHGYMLLSLRRFSSDQRAVDSVLDGIDDNTVIPGFYFYQ